MNKKSIARDGISNPRSKPKGGKRGPKPETLKLEGDWKGAVKKALKRKRPIGGWPK